MVIAGNILRKGRLWQMAACVCAIVWCLLVPAACMTPDKAVRETNETGTRLATDFWQRQTGRTNTFDVCRPADALTLRIALLAAARNEQGVVFPLIPHVAAGASNGVYCLSLADSLRVAARNDRKYQKYKEDIFFRALDLDFQQYAFETSFSGMMLGALSGGSGADQASGSASASGERTLPDGKTVAGRLAMDVVNLLRDDWRSLDIAGDLTVTVPLMRGAGREIVREPLTQSERNLIYAIQTFENYRQTYAVSVESMYYRVLQLAQQLENALENERRLEENSRRAEMMFVAGRMQRIQVDQARTDLLKAGDSVISTRTSYETQLDAFKVWVGLPPEGKVTVDPDELERLKKQLELYIPDASMPLTTVAINAGDTVCYFNPGGILAPGPHTMTLSAVGGLSMGMDGMIFTSVVPIPDLPTVITNPFTNITANSAMGGGIVTADGGAPVTARGVCWSTLPNPTILDSHTTDGAGLDRLPVLLPH